MNHLPLQCKPLDELLGGGIEKKSITEIHGESGSGKTNLCLQAAREYSLIYGKVAYIDSEGVSLERLKQICMNKNYKKILSNILFFTPFSIEKQEKMINNALKIEDVGLVIIDTINLFYRFNLEDEKECSMRSFSRQFGNLQIAARKKGLFVLLTEQVYTDKNGEIKPFTNRDIEHMVKASIRLEKIGNGKRKATIIKHRSQPEGKSSEFSITSDGLE